MDTAPSLYAAELIQTEWNFADPRQTEQRFRERSEKAFRESDLATGLQPQTQVAGAQGLAQRFAEASATLADVEVRVAG